MCALGPCQRYMYQALLSGTPKDSDVTAEVGRFELLALALPGGSHLVTVAAVFDLFVPSFFLRKPAQSRTSTRGPLLPTTSISKPIRAWQEEGASFPRWPLHLPLKVLQVLVSPRCSTQAPQPPTCGAETVVTQAQQGHMMHNQLH
jgi:hypothetical protein